LFSAQTTDNDASNLDARQANGSVAFLSTVPFHLGINDVLGADTKPFNPNAMTLFDSWKNVTGAGVDGARAAVARGQVLFNSKPIGISGVNGLNDDLNLPVINGTCTSCHDTPNVGNHSTVLPI